tara:strand:- start:3930 stop:4073 length:144 start_codon:yes stop_codon:yes gene_type:complete
MKSVFGKLVCPYCREPVSWRSYYTMGHVGRNCPLTKSQRDQLGMEEE